MTHITTILIWIINKSLAFINVYDKCTASSASRAYPVVGMGFYGAAVEVAVHAGIGSCVLGFLVTSENNV